MPRRASDAMRKLLPGGKTLGRLAQLSAQVAI